MPSRPVNIPATAGRLRYQGTIVYIVIAHCPHCTFSTFLGCRSVFFSRRSTFHHPARTALTRKPAQGPGSAQCRGMSASTISCTRRHQILAALLHPYSAFCLSLPNSSSSYQLQQAACSREDENSFFIRSQDWLLGLRRNEWGAGCPRGPHVYTHARRPISRPRHHPQSQAKKAG